MEKSLKISKIMLARTAMRNKRYYAWLLLAAGLVLIGLGIWVFLSPLVSYRYISTVFIILALIAGVFEISFSLLSYKRIPDWPMFVLGGLLDIIIAGYVFFNPWILMVLLPPFMGALLLVKLIVVIRNTVSIWKNKSINWWLVIIGMLLLLFLLQLLLANNSIEMSDLMALTGVGFVLAGVFRVYLFIKTRSLTDSEL